MHQLVALAKALTEMLSAAQAEICHQRAPTVHIHHTAIAAATMQPKTIGMDPVSRFSAICQLPAKAKAIARA
jgi:hypothetical protein